MQPKRENSNRLEPDSHLIQLYPDNPEPWWRSIGYNTISSVVTEGNLSSSEGNDGSESNDEQSTENGIMNEEDDATKESQATASSRSVGHCGQDQQNLKLVTSSMTKTHDQCYSQSPQLELVGHSIACAANLYQDPYYAGMMAAYGHQTLGYPHLVGMPQARMPLPLEMTQEPVYVNAKQYQGILRRRQARAKAEVEKKMIKVRKPYLHESRHQHALRRARCSGGRFAKKTEVNTSKQTEDKANCSDPVPSQSGNSSGSEALPSDPAETWNSTKGEQETGVLNTSNAHNPVNRDGHYQSHSGLQTSTYHSHPGEMVQDGDCSGKKWQTFSSNQASQRTLAIQ